MEQLGKGVWCWWVDVRSRIRRLLRSGRGKGTPRQEGDREHERKLALPLGLVLHDRNALLVALLAVVQLGHCQRGGSASRHRQHLFGHLSFVRNHLYHLAVCRKGSTQYGRVKNSTFNNSFTAYNHFNLGSCSKCHVSWWSCCRYNCWHGHSTVRRLNHWNCRWRDFNSWIRVFDSEAK